MKETSNKPAHTPGPCGTPDNDMPWRAFYAASVGQWQIWKGGVLVGTANTEANARLIASAPDLLAALERLLPVVSGAVKDRVYKIQLVKTEARLAVLNEELKDLYERANQARAAIAKATKSLPSLLRPSLPTPPQDPHE